MGKCAYCNNVEDITKEHVVNKSFIDRYYKEGKGYANVYDKYTENYLTVRDVCAKCNNGILSVFDSYFLDFYEANLPKDIITLLSRYELEYDFEKLSKWILKTLYNSERKNPYTHLKQKMHRYKDYIIGRDERVKLFRIYLELLSDVPKEKLVGLTELPDDFNGKLNFLRIGNIVFQEQIETGIKNTIKHLTSSNFMFHVFILDPGQHNELFFKNTLKKYHINSNTDKLFYIDPNKKNIKISGSNRTIVDLLKDTFEGNQHFMERKK